MEPENERADCFGRKQHMEPENDGFQVRNLLFQKPYFSGSTLNFRGVKENFPLEPRKNPDRILFMSHPGCLMQGSLFNCSWNNPRITGQRPLFSLLKWRLRLFTRFIALTVEVFLVNKKNSSLKKGWIYRTPPKRHPKSRWLAAFMKVFCSRSLKAKNAFEGGDWWSQHLRGLWGWTKRDCLPQLRLLFSGLTWRII